VSKRFVREDTTHFASVGRLKDLIHQTRQIMNSGQIVLIILVGQRCNPCNQSSASCNARIGCTMGTNLTDRRLAWCSAAGKQQRSDREQHRIVASAFGG
jgi:hypothetical protein